jgi:UDP-N-acetylmuramate--alanine ligase
MKRKHYFFIGIGGIGMSALAKIALEKGDKVSGSDISHCSIIEDLKALGAVIYERHDPSHITQEMSVVYSSGIREDNVELKQAKALHVPLYHRSDCLEEIRDHQKPLLIAGCHGKTSTTALLATCLIEGGLDPSVVVGGISKYLGTNGRLGKGDYFVAEADESDGSFLKTHGWGGIVTNTEEDHLSYWKSKANLLKAYEQFIHQVKHPELLFLCAEDPFLMSLNLQAHYYGFSEKASLRITERKQEGFFTYFSLSFEGKEYKQFKMNLQGDHQVLNATAVIGMALKLGVSEESLRKTLSTYQGVKRRLEFLGEEKEVKVFDDYAHHPTEVIATLAALKQALPQKRLIVIFQPHRYSRLKMCLSEFSTAFSLADVCLVTDVYSAGEVPLEGVHAEALVSQMKHDRVKKVAYGDLTSVLLPLLQPQDVVITLGAGDITRYGSVLLTQLK